MQSEDVTAVRAVTSNRNEELVSSPRPLLVPINLLQVPTVVSDLDEVMLFPRSDTESIKEYQRTSKHIKYYQRCMKSWMKSDWSHWKDMKNERLWHPMAWLNSPVELLHATSYHCRPTVIACSHSSNVPFFSSLGSQNITTLWDPVRQAGLCRWDFLSWIARLWNSAHISTSC